MPSSSATGAGGTAVFVDSGAPIAPLLQFARPHGLQPTHVLRTHSHADHVEHEDELDLPVMTTSFETGGLKIEAIPTPGHSDDMVCFVITDAGGRGARLLRRHALQGLGRRRRLRAGEEPR